MDAGGASMVSPFLGMAVYLECTQILNAHEDHLVQNEDYTKG